MCVMPAQFCGWWLGAKKGTKKTTHKVCTVIMTAKSLQKCLSEKLCDRVRNNENVSSALDSHSLVVLAGQGLKLVPEAGEVKHFPMKHYLVKTNKQKKHYLKSKRASVFFFRIAPVLYKQENAWVQHYDPLLTLYSPVG